MANRDKILEALNKLDPKNDNHWTISGEAKLDTIKFLSGGESVTRDQLNEIAPGFNREALAAHLSGASLQTEASNGGQAPAPVAGATGNGPSVQPEPLKVEVGSADRETEIEALAQKIRDADEEIQQCQRVQAEMTKKISVLQAEQQRLNGEIDKIKPPKSAMLNIQDYLESQKAAMRKRGEARRAVSDNGIDLNTLHSIMAPSPLDARLSSRPRIR